MEIPKKPGLYWAQWRVADEDTPSEHDSTPWIHIWEPVELTEENKVYLLGIPGTQNAENFVWGEAIIEPPRKPKITPINKEEEALRRYRAMTPRERYAFLEKARNGKG